MKNLTQYERSFVAGGSVVFSINGLEFDENANLILDNLTPEKIATLPLAGLSMLEWSAPHLLTESQKKAVRDKHKADRDYLHDNGIFF